MSTYIPPIFPQLPTRMEGNGIPLEHVIDNTSLCFRIYSELTEHFNIDYQYDENQNKFLMINDNYNSTPLTRDIKLVESIFGSHKPYFWNHQKNC